MNTAGIKAAIAKNGETQEKLAKALGLTPAALSKRVNGHMLFNMREVNRIRKRYKLSPEETVEIFFDEAVS